MSRSYHQNRSRRQFQVQGYRDYLELARKRRVKFGSRESRLARRSDSANVLKAAAIDISQEARAGVFYPASCEDLRSVMNALPGGVLDGLVAVSCETGIGYINAQAPPDATVDPVLGRWGYEMFPGIYGPAVLGIYALDSNRIRLFGYVKVPDRAVTEEQNRELRFEMLETLVHELAHHDDRTRRTARGRWRMDDRRKDEQYAVALEQEWCVEVVLPYLLARYGEGDE